MENSYESVVILKETPTEEEYKNILNEITEKIKEYVNIEKIEEMGLKRLAYAVKDHKIGYFVSFYFTATSQEVLELEREYRSNDNVLKFITVTMTN